jgi:hypothetical protein
MAYGSELYLGLTGLQTVATALRRIGISWQLEDDQTFDKINNALRKPHKEALAEIGLKVISPSRLSRSDGKAVEADPHYVYVQGIDGILRKTHIWRFEINYDPREMGHEPEDVLVGVSLISRYSPVFLDWNKDAGGSGETISLTPTVLAQIEVARKHIKKIVPFIKDAPIIFRERHY